MPAKLFTDDAGHMVQLQSALTILTMMSLVVEICQLLAILQVELVRLHPDIRRLDELRGSHHSMVGNTRGNGCSVKVGFSYPMVMRNPRRFGVPQASRVRRTSINSVSSIIPLPLPSIPSNSA